jgi:hypothetical protein
MVAPIAKASTARTGDSSRRNKFDCNLVNRGHVAKTKKDQFAVKAMLSLEMRTAKLLLLVISMVQIGAGRSAAAAAETKSGGGAGHQQLERALLNVAAAKGEASPVQTGEITKLQADLPSRDVEPRPHTLTTRHNAGEVLAKGSPVADCHLESS